MKKYSNRSAWTKRTPIFLKIGFVFALSFVLFAFQWEQKLPTSNTNRIEWEAVFETIHIPRTAQAKVTHSIPTLPKLTTPDFHVVEEEFDFEAVFETEADELELEFDIAEYLPTEATAQSAEVPIIVPVEDDEEFEEIRVFSSDMPQFGDCSAQLSKSEKRQCSDKAVMDYVYRNLKYPELAKSNGIEGTVIVEFIVNKSGDLTDISILRDIGAGAGIAVLETFRKMPKWKPGKHNARLVNVKLRMPIKFSLK